MYSLGVCIGIGFICGVYLFCETQSLAKDVKRNKYKRKYDAENINWNINHKDYVIATIIIYADIIYPFLRLFEFLENPCDKCKRKK